MRIEDKRFPAFDDTSKMPFGKYKDELLQDVPATYLKWLYDDMKIECETMSKGISERKINEAYITDKYKLYNYLHNSLDAIQLELKGK